MFKVACIVIVCAIVFVQCQAKKPHGKPDKENSHEQGEDSHEEKGGKLGFVSKGFRDDNVNDDVNVNVNVRVGNGAQQRPQWFGHRPGKGPQHDDEREGPHGGRPHPPREEANGTKPEGGRPSPRPHNNSTKPDKEESDSDSNSEESNENKGGHHGGNKHGHGGKGWGDRPSNDQNTDGNNDVNVNVNVQVSRGNGKNGGFFQHGRRPRFEGDGKDGGKGEGNHGPEKPEESAEKESSSSEQTD